MTAVLDRALAAHGGAERWEQAERLDVQATIDGELWGRRGQAGALHSARLELWPHEQRLAFHELGGAGRVGSYTPGRVELRGADGGILAERDSPAERAVGQTRTSAWDDLDLIYNAGFDLWHFLAGPFVLRWPGVVVADGAPWKGIGDPDWACVEATFPPSLVAHARRQRYAFDGDGLLREFLYVPERSGVPANVNTASRHRAFDGLVLPTLRTMLPRGEDGRPAAGPELMRVEIHAAQLR